MVALTLKASSASQAVQPKSNSSRYSFVNPSFVYSQTRTHTHTRQNSFNAQQRNAKDHDPHTVGGCLKRYLRELPEPILTHELYPEFMSTVQ